MTDNQTAAATETPTIALPPLPDIAPVKFWLLLLTGVLAMISVGLFGYSVMALFLDLGSEMVLGLPVLLGAAAIVVLGVVIFCKYFYRIWAIIPEDIRRTEPGYAVGFQFIPLFNLYWMYVAYYGWAQDYNEYLKQTGQTDVKPVNEQLFLAYPVMAWLALVAGFIPVLESVASPLSNGAMGIMLVLLFFMCRAVNQAIAARSGAVAETDS